MKFSKDATFCVFDYETYSEADLKKVGAFEYSAHPTTEIICIAWAIGTWEELKNSPKVQYWVSPVYGVKCKEPTSFLDALSDENIILVAHNAYFEQVITNNVLSRDFFFRPAPPERWICTASLSSAMAIPRNMEGAADALQLDLQKDMKGNRLIQKWCKPKKPSKKDPSTRHTNISELKAIVRYNITDVLVTCKLLTKLKPLTPREREVWIMDQEINLRGFKVDRDLVNITLDLIAKEVEKINEDTHAITDGYVTSATKTKALGEWLSLNGLNLPNMQRGTVEAAFLAECGIGFEGSPIAKILQNRLSISKTSTAKYIQFEQRSRTDGRLRDNLVYHGASTGRWAGSGVQPQNFPRGTIKDTATACSVIETGEIENVRFLYENPMEVFSSCLRNMIIPSPGHIFDAADYAAIEARVLFWVADHEDGVKAFRDNRKMYEELAAIIFGTTWDKIGKDSIERFVGKQAQLGCGYMMGWEKFQATCAMFGQIISDELAKAAVAAYRKMHWPVVMLWRALNTAAIHAVKNPGEVVKVNHTEWFVKNNFLFCKLPSGRCLSYPYPSITYVRPPWDETGEAELLPSLNYWEVNSKTRKFQRCRTYGGRLTENVVQGISRDLMADAMLRIRATKKWNLVLTVHDELLAERSIWGDGSNKEFCELMATVPLWANGCPVAVEGWEGYRYKK